MKVESGYDVCVVGGGPAGSIAALRLARLGYRVCVVERHMFPRPHVGESLTPGTFAILESLGLLEAVRALEWVKPSEVRIRWATFRAEHLAADGHHPSAMVDRGLFDELLLRAAAAAGARIFQPAQTSAVARCGDSWRIRLIENGNCCEVDAAFLIDATGRKGFFRRARTRVSARTMAICGRFPAPGLTPASLVEACSDGWCWAAPVSDASLSTMVFLDAESLRGLRPDGVEGLWRSCLAKTQLFANLAALPAAGLPIVCDASAYFDQHPVGGGLIRVGEANFALDPLSSTGLEKAVQTGVLAALVLHTTMLRPESAALCETFYRRRSEEIVAAHIEWSSRFYAEVEHYSDRPFWRARSRSRKRQPHKGPSSLLRMIPISPGTRVSVSQLARFVDVPCVVGNEIRARAALHHPALDRPVAFLEGADIVNLVRSVAVASDLADVVSIWSRSMLPDQAGRIAAWMLRHQILQPAE